MLKGNIFCQKKNNFYSSNLIHMHLIKRQICQIAVIVLACRSYLLQFFISFDLQGTIQPIWLYVKAQLSESINSWQIPILHCLVILLSEFNSNTYNYVKLVFCKQVIKGNGSPNIKKVFLMPWFTKILKFAPCYKEKDIEGILSKYQYLVIYHGFSLVDHENII